MAPLATTALLLLPRIGDAEQLESGVSTAVSWSDTVFDQSDFSGRVTPFGTVSDPDGELTWSLRYAPSYEHFLDLSEVSGFDQDVQGAASWRFAERWTFSLRENYASNQSAIRFNEAAAPGQEVAIGFRDQEVRSNRAGAVLSHLLNPRDTLSLSVAHNTQSFEETRRGDPSSVSTSLAYRHVLSERTATGLSLSWVQQARSNGVAEDDRTNFYNLAGTLEHRFSPTLRLTASAGPTLVDSTPAAEFELFEFALKDISFGGSLISFALDADGCNFQGVPGRAGVRNFQGCSGTLEQLSDDDARLVKSLTVAAPTVDEQGLPIESGDAGGTDLTYFASVALVKDWERWTGSLNYQRSNSESATFGSSSVADSFYGRLTWEASQFWTVSLAAGITLQEQVGDQIVPVAFDLVNVDAAPLGVVSVDELAQVQRLVATISDNALEYRTESVSFSVNRRLGRHASAYGSVYWYSQEQEVDTVDLQTTRRADSFRLSVGLRWNFDPIRF